MIRPDSRTLALNARYIRQRWTLASLAVVAVVLLAVRLIGRSSHHVLADTGPATGEQSHEAAKSNDSAGAKWRTTPVAVTWPVSLKRDIFAAETDAARPYADTALDADAVARDAKARLTLYGTILGDPPLAIVNRRPLCIGASIEGFKLLRIESSRIVVEKMGVDVKVDLRSENH